MRATRDEGNAALSSIKSVLPLAVASSFPLLQYGSIFVFEDKPSIATDIACDTWDVKTGEVLQISPPTPMIPSDLDLGDWRDSLVELNDEVLLD